MASQNLSILSLPLVASATVAAKRFITQAGAQAAAGAQAFGVNRFPVAAGEAGTVDVLGTAQVEAGAAITLGAAVEAAADGKARTLDAGVKLGRALEAADADGDIIEILLIPS